jgi:hypothetical protein
MSDNFIETDKNGNAVSYVGPDAVDLYRVRMVRMSIKLHRDTGMIPTRGVTITRLLAMASQYTGKAYKGKTKHDAAIADLDAHIAAFTASMPIKVR